MPPSSPRLLCAAAFAVLCAGSGGCARPLPPEQPASYAYRDLQRLVSLSAATGWKIDRVEVESLLPDALMTVCQVTPATRAALLAWLDERIAALGGPVEEAYARAGGSLRAISELVELSRVRMTLARAIEVADDDCPFWIEADDRFRGRQVSDDRWQLSLGGGGKGIVANQDGQTDIRAGGAGRLLFGRTIGPSFGVYTGVETGAIATFPKDDDGNRSNLLLGVELVVPLVVRYTHVNTYVEAEVGWLGRVTEDDVHSLDHGFHLGAAFGGRATRRRWFFPGAAFGVSYEQTVPRAGEPVLRTFKFGFRVAIDMDL
jgi:hypothetical protein